MATQTQSKNKPGSRQAGLMRRSALAYVGLHGMAYERARMRLDQARKLTDTLFSDLVDQGEGIEAKTAVIIKDTQISAFKKYAKVSETVQRLVPGKQDILIEELEDEVAKLSKKLKAMKLQSQAKASTRTVTQRTSETASKAAKAKTQDESTSFTASKTLEASGLNDAREPVRTEAKQPRHLPYFNDVKRYDPLANEDIVRKIVNHCGIALRSNDARYVACSDAAERNRVRDSWLKKKLGLDAADGELDIKVQHVCQLMQGDNRKNRVTFYYLAAKAAGKLDTL